MNSNNLFSNEQHGFMKGKSRLLESTEDWSATLDNYSETDFIFYDFRKAFDTLSQVKFVWNTRQCLQMDRRFSQRSIPSVCNKQ